MKANGCKGDTTGVGFKGMTGTLYSTFKRGAFIISVEGTSSGGNVGGYHILALHMSKTLPMVSLRILIFFLYFPLSFRGLLIFTEMFNLVL